MKKLLTFSLSFSLFFLFLTGCDDSESSKKFVNLRVGIDVLERAVKSSNIKYSDIKAIKLTVLDSQKTYLANGSFEQSYGLWSIDVNNLPVNRDIQFIAEAFNSDDDLILKGNVTEKITSNSSQVLIPLQLANEIKVVALPSIESISVGETGSNLVTKISFVINNYLRDEVHWKIIPDSEFDAGVDFNQTEGNLTFEDSSSRDLSITISGDIDEHIYTNRIEITNSNGDKFGEEFKVSVKRDQVNVSIAPIVDNIYLYMQSGVLYAEAIVDSSFGSELQYYWELEKDSLPVNSKTSRTAYISGFEGNLTDTLILKVTNSSGITSRYSYIVDLQSVNINSTISDKIDPTECIPPVTTSTTTSGSTSTTSSTTTSTSGGTSTPIISEDDFYFDFKFSPDKYSIESPATNDDYSRDIELAFGETVTFEANTTATFEELFDEELFNRQNMDYITFDSNKTRYSDVVNYQFKITPKGVREGDTYFKFFVKNRYRSEYVQFTIESKEITEIIDVKERYQIYKDSNETIELKFRNDRGHPLEFNIDGSNMSYSEIMIDGDRLFSNNTDDENGITLKLMVDGNQTGEEFLDVNVTDLTLNYTKTHKIIVEVVERSATNLVEDLYECGLNSELNSYEVTADSFDTSGSETEVNDANLKVKSLNEIENRVDLSTVVVFTVDGKDTSGSDGEYYIYTNSQPFKDIGYIKYKESLSNTEFYVKYYDENLNKVICEKHRFPELSGVSY